MGPRPSDLASLINAVLDERAESVSFSEREIDAEAAKLRAGLARVRESVAARQRITGAIEDLPAERRGGWLEGVQAAIKIVLGETRRTSRIMVDAASGLMPPAPEAWTFAAAAGMTTRSGDTATTKAESIDEASAVSRTVIVDDAASEPRVLATIANYPVGTPPPVLLIVPEDGDRGDLSVIEIDPEIELTRSQDADGGHCRLRYEAALPSGAYYLFFGNPRDRGR
jgi:hypothetical protein